MIIHKIYDDINELVLPDDLQRLGVASRRRRAFASRSHSDSGTGPVPGASLTGLGALEREDMVDSRGTRWRCFATGEPPQESRVNMSVLEPYLRVLSHGGTNPPEETRRRACDVLNFSVSQVTMETV